MGKFIVIEGADGAGTTTQVQRFAERYEREIGRRVIRTREPSDGRIGISIRRMLKEHSPHPLVNWRTAVALFSADRQDHVSRIIGPALMDDECVVCDRYLLSTLVYQTLELQSDMIGMGEAVNWIRAINQYVPVPDLTIVLRVPPDVLAARIQGREQEEFYDKHQALVAEHYGNAPRLLPPDHAVAMIDASLSEAEVEERIWQLFISLPAPQ